MKRCFQVAGMALIALGACSRSGSDTKNAAAGGGAGAGRGGSAGGTAGGAGTSTGGPGGGGAGTNSGAGGVGQAGSGGAAGTSGAGLCSGGSVEFRIDASDRSGWFIVDSGQDCIPPNWLALYDEAGKEIAVGNPDLHCCTFPSCATCSFNDVACANAWFTAPLPATRIWDGMIFPQETCGDSARACVRPKTCAPVGHYTARMCVRRYGDAGGQPLQQPITCVDVPFEFPSNGTVVGTLP